ncbi:MAG: AraC family transcriptional regulator [Tepidisphaeraceae bacterium]
MTLTTPIHDAKDGISAITRMELLQKHQNALARSIGALAPVEGANVTRLSGVTLYRVTEPQPPSPTLYNASIVLVGQGVKRAHLGTEIYEYSPSNFLVMTSPMPLLCEIVASPKVPVLTMTVEIDPSLLSELIIETGESAATGPSPRGVYSAAVTPAVIDTGVRLLNCLANDESSRVLGRQTVRELIYHVLSGPQGHLLRALSPAGGRTAQLGRVIRHMNANFDKPMSVEDLAKMAHLSVPVFHQHFKAVTATSPLQYIKAVRLTKARLLMMQDGLSAKEACRQVGYESDSQFSREFRRYFGTSPVASVRGMATTAE